MEKRYRIDNGVDFVEMPRSVEGELFLEGLRHNMPDTFRNCRIKEISQAYPSKVPIGTLLLN